MPEIALEGKQFYRGETRAGFLGFGNLVSEINFLFFAPGWDLNRWGRVRPLPMFVWD